MFDPAKTAQIRADFEIVKSKAATEWGAFRRWLSAHPLTGFWLGAGVGAGAAVVARFFLV